MSKPDTALQCVYVEGYQQLWISKQKTFLE